MQFKSDKEVEDFSLWLQVVVSDLLLNGDDMSRRSSCGSCSRLSHAGIIKWQYPLKLCLT